MDFGIPDEKGSLMSPIKKESMVDKIINKITDAVVSGELKPGDQLPPETKLAESMGASKNTVREAIKILVAYGVVEIRRPEGTFICSGFSQKMLNPMLYSILFSKTNSARDLLGLRQMIDSGVLQLVQQQGLSKRDEARLESIFERLKDSLHSESSDLRQIADTDIELHNAIAAASGNELVQMINDVVSSLTYDSRLRTIERIYADDNREYLVTTHREILDILEGKSTKPLNSAIEFSYLYWKHSYNW